MEENNSTQLAEKETPPAPSGEAAMQQELLALLGDDKKKKIPKYVFAIAAAAVIALAFGVFKFISSRAASTDEVTYRQYTVQRGDVVVGTTESSSISLDRETVKYPVSTTVEKIFVKAGQSVKEGDPLMQLNLEEIEAGLVTYQLQVKMAELELEQAKLDEQTKLLKARQTYNSAVLTGQLAANNQTISITELERQLANAQEDLEDTLESLHDYEDYEDNYDDDYASVTRWKTKMNTYKTLYETYATQLENVTLDSGDVAALTTLYQNAYNDYLDAKEEYTERLADFNEDYDIDYGDDEALEEKIDDLKDKIESYNIALEKAKMEQQTGTLSAANTKALAELSAQTALAQYNLTELQLSQDVDEAQETYDQTLRQINDIKKSVADDGIVYAPCTGMIVSLSLDEGDDFDVTYDEDKDVLNEQTLLTMTDISSVYVPITISEEDILGVTIGQQASVTMSAFEGRTFDAEVDTISVEAARSGAATVSYTVTVRYNGVNTLDMYEGMSAETTLLQREASDVLYINNQAVTNTAGVATVQLLGDDGNAVTTNIKTGFSNGQYVEVTDGLDEGDIVLAISGVSR